MPRALLLVLHLKLQRYKDTVRGAALDAEVPGHRHEQLDTNLDCLLKTHFLHLSLIEKSQQNLIELVTRPEAILLFSLIGSVTSTSDGTPLAP